VHIHLPVNGITKADVSDIKKMRDAGTPIVEIAKKWNLSREEIFKLLHN
jgi:Mor family transcriptional regulator